MHKRFAAVAIVALVAGCGGGGANVTPQRSPQTVNVAFSIAVTTSAGAKLRRVPNYVSSATQSAAVTVAPSGGTASAPTVVNCTAVCSGSVNAPAGSDTFTVNLYDAQNGAGHLLSTGTLTQTIVLDAANSVNLTFNGVVASLSVSLGAGATAGTAASIPVTVNALDAAGKTIVGPGVFVNANGMPLTVTLTDSDVSGATTLSSTSITQPTSGITLSYTGLAIAPATITASASGVPSGTGAFAPTLQAIGPATLSGGVYTNAYGASSPVSFTASETGWTSAPYSKPLTAALSAACGWIATVSPASGTTFAVTLVASPGNGSCTLTLSDGAGQSLVIPIGYHAYAYTGSMQTFTPASGVTTINITALGAGGGPGSTGGGIGAGEFGTFTVTPGSALNVLVGGTGITSSNGAGGGGGGSFVYISGASAPLIAAGGGGGGGLNGAGSDASTSTSGVAGGDSGASGGSGGNGGGCITNSGGGGGFLTAGSTCNGVNGGSSIQSGGAGGQYPAYASGGFGGGGAAAAPGGGGGGYSGGGAGGVSTLIGGGGGGGSYNTGTNASTMPGAASGNNGSVIITW